MKVYISTAALWNVPMGDILRYAAKTGFDGAEIWAEQLKPHESPVDIGRLARELGLAVCCHAASWDLNLCSHNRAVREVSMEETLRSLRIARELGAGDVTVHPGRKSSPVVDLPLYRKRMAYAAAQICEEAAGSGMRVSFELMEKIPKEFVTSPPEMARMLAGIDPGRCGITLDAAHLDSAGMFLEYLEEMPRVDKIHLSNRKGAQFHTPVFDGDLDMEIILDRISRETLPVVVEGNQLCFEELDYILRTMRKAQWAVA